LDNLSEGIAICSPVIDGEGKIIDFTYEYGNDALSLIIKLDKDFMLKKRVSEVFTGFSETELFRQCCNVISTGNPEKRSSIEINQTVLDHKLQGFFDLSITNCKGCAVVAFHDVTEAKKKENELERSQEDLKLLFENTFDALIMTSPDGRIYKANPAAERLLGYTEEEICRLGRTALADASDPNWELAISERAITGKFAGILKFRRKDGSTFQGEVTSVLLRMKDGSSRTSTAFRDITEQLEAEKKIRQISRQMEDIINGAPNPIFVKDLEGKFIIINKKLEELLGTSNEEVKGKTDFDIISRDSAEFFREYDRKISEAGKLMQVEEEADLADGQHHIFMTNKFPLFDQNGQVYATCGISTDITGIKKMERELRGSEERFRIVQEVSPDGFTILKPYFDQNGKLADFIFVYENPAVASMNGTVPDEVIGRRLLEIFPGHQDTQFFKTYVEVYESGRVIEFEDHYKGETIIGDKWFRIVAVPISDGVAILAQDITERKLSEHKIIETLEELERSNKELEQFAYVASHDLQEPLRMISSYITMLDRKYSDLLDDGARQYIHFAVDGAKRMADLIHDLLSYSRLNTRKESFKFTDLNIILDEVRRDLQVAIQEAGAELKIGDMPELKVDQSQIKQLFQNLIQNAIKFRGKEFRTSIDVTSEYKEGSWIFSIRDNGIGISPEYHEKIFLLFQQLHGKDQYSGTGLGLAICKKIVERHGGRIWIESEEGKGSTFHFTLHT
ncbi:MAG: PAS domain S-box protein, partial [Syntrophothermus sp.]